VHPDRGGAGAAVEGEDDGPFGDVLDALAAQGAKVIPRCPFVADYIRRNPEYARLAATS